MEKLQDPEYVQAIFTSCRQMPFKVGDKILVFFINDDIIAHNQRVFSLQDLYNENPLMCPAIAQEIGGTFISKDKEGRKRYLQLLDYYSQSIMGRMEKFIGDLAPSGMFLLCESLAYLWRVRDEIVKDVVVASFVFGEGGTAENITELHPR